MVNICRLCATLRKDEQLLVIDDTNHEICQQLRKCCQVEIRIEDPLPKCVCHDCVQALQQSFAFYTKVHESQESLTVFYPAPTGKNDSAKAVEKETVLEQQLLQLKANDDEEAETDIIKNTKQICENKTEIQIPLTVKKVGTDDEIEKRQVISIIEEDGETTLILEESFDDDGEDEIMFIGKILEKSNNDEVLADDQKSCDTHTLQITQVDEKNETTDEESSSLSVVQSKTLPHYKSEAEMQDFLEEETNATLNQEEKDIEPVQATDISASNETWSSYPWSCHICNSDESCFWDLVLHCQFTHEMPLSDMQFKCADCQKICFRYYNFINHVRFRHRTALALCCDVCDTRCVDLKLLSMHRRIRHADDLEYPPILLCDECGRGFSNQNALTMHKKAHNENQTFQCNQCSAQFKRLYSLKAHQKVHSGLKEYSCNHCEKSFRQKVNLEAHMYSHTDEKPYQCSICKKSFKTSMNLMKHNVTHTDIKQFKCDHCERTFRTKDAKLSHERTHTGEMPYTCEYCMRRFRFRSTYLGHLNTHTGKRPYSCVPCDHHFTNWSNYNKHMKRRHAHEMTNQTKTRTSKINKKSEQSSYIEYEYSVLNEPMNEDSLNIIEET